MIHRFSAQEITALKIQKGDEPAGKSPDEVRKGLKTDLVYITMAFMNTAVDGLKSVVTIVGAGLGVWGVINLLEGYGGDNPAAKSQGIKQFGAGAGIIIIAQTVIPQLTSLFS